ncbi:protein artemis-like [Protopterus annectens]|uniref:protein artemis-like n=1 Tax=Protopterus annectens TaxID=7888 RepID=UPI001CF99840|nr:protein artemis-like [Protopterus annectens]
MPKSYRHKLAHHQDLDPVKYSIPTRFVDELKNNRTISATDSSYFYSGQASASNFVDCEESNDDEYDDDDEENKTSKELVKDPIHTTEFNNCLSSELKFTFEKCDPPKCSQTSSSPVKVHPNGEAVADVPKWDMFFKHELVSEDEHSETEDTCANSKGIGGSLSPNLFSDSDGDSTCISSQTSSQSTHISEMGSQDHDSQKDTVLISSEERRQDCSKIVNRDACFLGSIAAPYFGHNQKEDSLEVLMQNKQHSEIDDRLAAKEPDRVVAVCNSSPGNLSKGNLECSEKCAVRAEEHRPVTVTTNTKSDSQTSSDFEIPSTPDSELPESEKLGELYRKLAAGEPIKTEKSNWSLLL